MKKRCFILVVISISLVLISSNLVAMSSDPVEEEWQWEESTPEEQGIDSEKLIGVLDYIEDNNTELTSLLIMRNGELVTEVYYPPYEQEDETKIYSVTKSVISSLIGIALEEGYIESIEQPASEFFSEYYTEDMDPKEKEITIENLLMMAAGYEFGDGNLIPYKIPSDVAFLEQLITRSLVDQPFSQAGEEFIYDNFNSDLLAAILTESTGMSVVEFAEEYLFNSIGINNLEWDNMSDMLEADKDYYSGAAGLYLTTREMAKFGQLHLNNGYWDEKEVVPEDWINSSTQKRIEDPRRYYDYGYHWWVAENGYLASGHGGQNIKVIPELDMVIVTSAMTNHNSVYNIINNISSAVEGETLEGNEQAVERLEERINRIENPESEERGYSSNQASYMAGNVYNFEANDWGIESLKFDDNDEEKVYLTLNDESDQTMGFSLNGDYYTSSLETEGFLSTVSIKGEWINDDSLNIKTIFKEAQGFYDMDITVSDESITLYLRNMPYGNGDILTGELEND